MSFGVILAFFTYTPFGHLLFQGMTQFLLVLYISGIFCSPPRAQSQVIFLPTRRWEYILLTLPCTPVSSILPSLDEILFYGFFVSYRSLPRPTFGEQKIHALRLLLT